MDKADNFTHPGTAMPVYKFTFANNAVISCTEATGKTLNGGSYYEHHHGNLIYAFVEAGDEKQARIIADRMIDSFTTSNKKV